MRREPIRRWTTCLGALALGAVGSGCSAPDTAQRATSATVQAPAFTLFESDQVRPMALSPNGNRLFVVNTPDNRLETFSVTGQGIRHVGSVAVGLEPVAVAVRNNQEVWVVNHLSDSVSIVRVGDNGGSVVRTLYVGDEPRDVVFAGPGNSRAFITAAHRGQNIPFDPQHTTPGVGRADVWVFNADDPGPGLGGTPTAIVNLFTDKPRALAVSPDGSRVYAAGYFTGNQTTIIPQGAVRPGLYPPPLTNYRGDPAPVASLIVRWNGRHWVDERNTEHDYAVRLSLPDRDVFVIDAMANPPALAPGDAGSYAHVGTVLFNMVVNPVNNRVYVSNTEALNEQRFEGPGIFAGHSVRGHTHESRITVLGAPGDVRPRHLNPHINYGSCCAPIPNDENARSLAFPQSMAVTADGATLYVAALGSSKVGVLNTAELEAGTYVPSTSNQIRVTGGGPTGMVLDESRNRLYVFTRFDNSVSVIDTTTRREAAHVALFNPEPSHVVAGRRFLYDAEHTSSHGDSACASCHVFGDFDALAWDLGNPDADVEPNANPFANPVSSPRQFHPMKGPMTTQSLRGMANHGPMHWRGDRTGGNAMASAQPDDGAFDEVAAFMAFRPAFAALVGRHEPIPESEMRAFTTFILDLTYPPNPNRRLDNSLTPSQQAGRDAFFRMTSLNAQDSGRNTCNACHVLDPNGNAGRTAFPGFFGTDGRSADVLEPQLFKIPHLRNAYQKIGMFGAVANPVFFLPGNDEFRGDQIRGFGFAHDGEVDTIFRFNTATLFVQEPITNPGGIPIGPEGDVIRRQMEDFMLAFDSNLAPIVGQQVTLTASNGAAAGPRIDLLTQRAAARECDLIASCGGTGYFYRGGRFVPDTSAGASLDDAGLRARAATNPVTYTCVPPGEGYRRGIDRDHDGALDGDERAAGTNPADPASHP